MKLFPLDFIQWHRREDGALGYEVFTVLVDERLPLSDDSGPRYPGRPWYRHCYVCGLDEGGSHYPTCYWIAWMNLTKETDT